MYICRYPGTNVVALVYSWSTPCAVKCHTNVLILSLAERSSVNILSRIAIMDLIMYLTSLYRLTNVTVMNIVVTQGTDISVSLSKSFLEQATSKATHLYLVVHERRGMPPSISWGALQSVFWNTICNILYHNIYLIWLSIRVYHSASAWHLPVYEP